VVLALAPSCQPREQSREHTAGGRAALANQSGSRGLLLANLLGQPLERRAAVDGRPNVPVVNPDKLAALSAPWPMFRGGPDGRATAGVIAETLQVRWSFNAGAPIRSSPILGPAERLYFGADDGRLRSLTADGKRRWEFSTAAPIRSTAAIARDVLYTSARTTAICTP
jgi:outer membrane protein assembly factor BamB